MRLDLTTLRIFLSVYNLRSLTRAAEREHIAPSAVSKRIHDLELDLDTPLFRRHPRGVSPTAAGEALVRHVQALFANVNRLEADLGAYASGVQGQIRIHAHSSAVVQYLPGDISDFLRQHPGVRIDLREESTNAVLQSVVDGVADIGVYGGNVQAPPGTRVLDYRRDHLVAVLPTDHELAGRDSLAFSEIQGSDHISLETGSSLQVLLAGAAEAAGMRLSVKIEVTTFQAAWRMVEAGLGVAVMPKGVVASAVEEGRVVAAPLTDDWAHRRLSICVREGRDLAAPARRMLEHLTAAAAAPFPSAKDALLNHEWKDAPAGR
ncbi:LysR family transcriptional regulator [Alsobacter soli]|nr:LysR family transcriptional regulator [Alsobacter soli]